MVDLNCSALNVVASSIYTFIVGLLFISIIYTCRIFLINKSDEKLSKTIISLHIIFLISTIYCITYYPILRWYTKCIESLTIPWFIAAIFVVLWFMQIAALTILLYLRLVMVFTNTSYAISKCIQYTYNTIFIAIAAIFILTIIVSLITESYTIFSSVVAVLLVAYIFIMISLTILFIRKLVAVYRSTYHWDKNAKNNNENDKGLVEPITRLTILISLSMVFTILLVIMQVIRVLHDTEVAHFMIHAVGVANLYMNFVNAMMTNKIFVGYYRKICAPLDVKCRKCCMRIIHGTTDEIRLSNTLETEISVQ